jgi:hypothetical protein
MDLLCAVVAPLPVGTNLGLLHLLWMMVSGRLVSARGALIPGLTLAGLSPGAVRRAWASLGQGHWTCAGLLHTWATVVQAEGYWQPHSYAGYQVVAADVTGYWRPRLRGCPTKHYHAAAGKALPAIPVGILARIGSVVGPRGPAGAEGETRSRLGLPLALVRADPDDASPGAHQRALVKKAAAVLGPKDLLVSDRGFTVGQLQAGGVARYVTRLVRNFTAQRANPPAYPGRGRPAKYGATVRPLARQRHGQVIAATPPDEVVTWQEGAVTLRAERWSGLVLPRGVAGSPTFNVVAIYDPEYAEPLLLATSLDLTPAVLREIYRDRWPVEQLPLAAKQMVGAARQFVHAPETCQRLPELSLLAGSIQSYAAAKLPAVPTGNWDRRPRPTPGRLRRVLGQVEFPTTYPLPGHIREKSAVTDHLPKGFWGQRRAKAAPEPLTSDDQPGKVA